nr:hypothetical protein [Tanacetum cinerariifolium]
MSTQQDIYSAGSESRPPMLNKENYVPWSSRLLRYAKSRPNGKLIHNSILNGPYVRKMIPKPGDANREITRISSKPRNRQIAQPGMNMVQDRQMQMVRARAEGNAARKNGNQIRCYNCRGVGHYARNCTVMPRRREAAYHQTQLLIAQKEEARIQLQAKEYDLMAAAADLDKIKEVNANCILMANLQQASTSGTQTDSAPIYDTDGSAEVHENCDDNEIFNMFTQEEQYTELLEPIPESHQVPQNDNDVISEDTSVEQGGETVEQHPANFEETRALYESLYYNLAIKVEKVNSVNRKLKETNADLTTELARFKNQERCFEIKTLQLAQESRDKMKQMNKEIKLANYTKINHLSGVFVPQTALLREESYFSNNSKMVNVSKSFLIPNEDLSDDTTPSVARKFINEVKSTIVTLQRVVKQRMTIETHNWASSAHQELHKIEAAKFVEDFKSFANEADASLAKHKALELEIKRLLKAVLFKKVSDQKDNTQDTSKNTKFAKQPIVENLPKIGKTNDLSKPVTSNSVSIPQESKGVNNDKVISPGMFRINPDKTSREAKKV